MTDNPAETPQTPIADFGDWVRVEGRPGTVISAQPYYDGTADRYGHSYVVMFPGGDEREYVHYNGDDHLTPAWPPRQPQREIPLFEVVTPND